jgi:hypothetical protein
MGVSGEVTMVQDGGEPDRQSAGSPVEPREWYFRASAEFSSCVVSRELERIIRYVTDTDTHAHNLGVLWMTDPFSPEVFIREAGTLADKSDEIEETVARLKDTVIRFVHASMPDDGKKTRSPGRRRRIVRRRSAPGFTRNRNSGHHCGVRP